MSNKTFDLNKSFDDFLDRSDPKSVCLQLLLAAFCVIAAVGLCHMLYWLIILNHS